MDSSEIADRLEIQDLVARYASRVDRRDLDGVAELFTEDGALLSPQGSDGEMRERRGRGQIAEAMRALERYRATTHLVGQNLAEISGETAHGETYCLAHHIIESDEGGHDNHVMAIRYMDRYRKAAGRWLFAERRLVVDWTETRSLDDAGWGRGQAAGR
jgi:uncharacterized protein (TIGR02246 family)